MELNFFLTKYYEMVDRDGRKVSVFALNYGLCRKYTIRFGRPAAHEFRTYFIERVFDYTPILLQYMKTNQEIACTACMHKFELEQLPALQLFHMRCPECNVGVCRVVNLSRKYESILRSVGEESLLPRTDFGILQTLQTEKKAMKAAEIAEDLDCSYQLVGKRGKILEERGLVDRRLSQQKRLFQVTDMAEELYFAQSAEDRLNVKNGAPTLESQHESESGDYDVRTEDEDGDPDGGDLDPL